MKKISVVIPCYRSALTIAQVVDSVVETMAQHSEYDYEMVLVNDGSPDNLMEILRPLAAGNSRVKVIDLARNFGQHAAIMAGFNHCSGDVVVCMDDDGQTPAAQMFRLIDRLDEDCDLVFARYVHKHHSAFRNLGSKFNELMQRALLKKPKNLVLMSYFACKRYVMEEACRYTNPYPYVSGILLRVTNRVANVEIDHQDRLAGESTYTLGKLVALWMNGFTAFSVVPLRIATYTGALFALSGFVYALIIVIRKLINPLVPMGYSSTMAVLLLLGGLILIMLGLLGEYLGRMYISINNAPQYVVRGSCNIEPQEGDATLQKSGDKQ